MTIVKLSATACVLFCLQWMPAIAFALPPEKVVILATGDARYVKAAYGRWEVISTDEKVARAGYFKPNEVLIEAGKPGTALISLNNDIINQFLVWKVIVGDKPTAERPDPSVLAGPCGCGRDGSYPVSCTVKNTACLDALRELFTKSDLSTEDVRVIYGIPAAQALLKQMQIAVEKAGYDGVELALVGANLRVKAAVADENERRKLLLLVYRNMIGKLVLDDKIVVAKPKQQVR